MISIPKIFKPAPRVLHLKLAIQSSFNLLNLKLTIRMSSTYNNNEWNDLLLETQIRRKYHTCYIQRQFLQWIHQKAYSIALGLVLEHTRII